METIEESPASPPRANDVPSSSTMGSMPDVVKYIKKDSKEGSLELSQLHVTESDGRKSPTYLNNLRRKPTSAPVHRVYKGAEFAAKYRDVKDADERFTRIASLTTEVTSIYRSRTYWVTYAASDLIQAAEDMFEQVPAARSAVLHFIGLLVHENTHQFFLKTENPQCASDFSSVENAAVTLLKIIGKRVEGSDEYKEFALSVLSWCCSLAAELCVQNSGRPSVTKTQNRGRDHEDLLQLFQQCPSIKELIKLLDTTITWLQSVCPEECMAVLFDSSTYGVSFNWIWLHIAITFPGSIVDHLFTVGAQQFKAYVEDIRLKEQSGIAAILISPIHEEFNQKFMSLSEVFNFLTGRRNLELKSVVGRMIKESLECDPKDGVFPNLDFVFFFKLVTCSVDTLRFLFIQNSDLATPENFYRGIRQIMSVDRSLVLSTMTYSEFSKQMVSALMLDTNAMSIVFNVLMQIAFDANILAGYDQEVCKKFREGSITVVDNMIHMLVRLSHTELISAVDFPAFTSFSSRNKLQFIINVACSDPTGAGVIIRYLHAVSIVCGEQKAAEIAGRMLFAAQVPKCLLVLFAFVSATCPFYPDLMQSAFRQFSSIRKIIEGEGYNIDKYITLTRILSNVTHILECEEGSTDKSTIRYMGFYPGAALGPILCDLVGLCIDYISEALEVGRMTSSILEVLHAVSRLITASGPNEKQHLKQGYLQKRSILLHGRHVYKLSLQLASLLRLSLAVVCKGSDESLISFEDIRQTISIFLKEQLNVRHSSSYSLFLNSYVTGCFQEAEELFGDKTNLDPWRIGVNEKSKELEDDGAFLDSVRKMNLKKSVTHHANSGVIGKGARWKQAKHQPTADQHYRARVFVESMRTFCIHGTREENVQSSKQLGLLVTDIVCQDALAGDYNFSDWADEKEVISRYLDVERRLEASWVCQGLIEVVSQTSPCLFTCLPIIKAQLAAIVSRLENSLDKTRRLHEDELIKIDKWMRLVLQAEVLPARFELAIELISEIPIYEAFLLIVEFWKYFQKSGLTLQAIEAAHTSAIRGDPIRLKGSTDGCFEVYRLVIQKNIVSLGYLFPLLFVEEIETLNSEIQEIASP